MYRKKYYHSNNNNGSYDYIIRDYKNINNPNSQTKKNNKMFSNTTYDFKKINCKPLNNKEEKRIPMIVVTKKPNRSKTSMNFFKKRQNIIKIQSVWRGYFFRNIAVGSIKKYIGFIALIKYMEKSFFNNIEYLFYDFLYLLKKYCNESKYIYKKINNKNDNLRNYRNYTLLDENITDDSNDNNYKLNELKANLFVDDDYNEYVRDKNRNNKKDNKKLKYTPDKIRKTRVNISYLNNDYDIKDNPSPNYVEYYNNSDNDPFEYNNLSDELNEYYNNFYN